MDFPRQRLEWVDRGTVRVAAYVAAGLMFGMLLAVWLRVLDAVAGRTVYTLAVVTGIVTAGVAAGYSLAGLAFLTGRRVPGLLRALFLLIGCWLAVQLAGSDGVVAGWQRILNDLSRTFGQYVVAVGKTTAFFCLVPSLLAGMAVHAVLRSFLRVPEGERAQGMTLVLLLAVLPAWVGYGFASGVVIPVAGVENVLRFGALWFGALAAVVAWRGVRSVWPFATVAGLLYLLNPSGGGTVLEHGVFGRLVHRDSGFAQGAAVFSHPSRHHTVAAYEDTDYRFVFALDGRPVLFGNRFHTARTLCGYVPLLLRPESRKAAVFGPEAGLYLPFLVRGGVTNVAFAGADEAVVKLTLAADGYLTGAGCEAAGRVRRRARLSSRAEYDIVFLAPEPSWMRGTGRAYGAGLFRRCRAALSEKGVVALHLDARALSQRRFAAVARAFVEVFPHVQVWCAGTYDWLLVGGVAPLTVAADRMLEVFERGPVVRDFARAGILSLPEVLPSLVCDGEGIAAWLACTEGEAAWQAAWGGPRTVFGEGQAALQPAALEGCRQRKLGWVSAEGMDEEVYLAVRARADRYIGARVQAVAALSEMAAGRGEAALAAAREASAVNPRDALLVHLAEKLELEGRRRTAFGDFKGALKCYENLLAFRPGGAHAHYGMGYCLRATGEGEGAYLHFARAVAAAPEQTGYRMELAQAAVAVGEYAEADRQYEEVLKREPGNAEALFRYARAAAQAGRPDRDMAKAVRLAEQACVATRWGNREHAFGLADLYIEAGRVLEGMGLKRRLKETGLNRGE